jgi:hypothetical protein
MWQEKISKDTVSFGRSTAMGTAKIIGKNNGVLMATSFGILPMVVGLDFSACPGCIQRGSQPCEYSSFCPVLAASREKAAKSLK